MSWEGCRTTLYRGIKRDDGKLVVLDRDHLLRTTKVVGTARDYEIAVGQGWVDSPQEAMRRIEASEDAIAYQAAESASDDRHMSEKAQREIADYESSTLEHVLEIPVAHKTRGRPKKIRTET